MNKSCAKIGRAKQAASRNADIVFFIGVIELLICANVSGCQIPLIARKCVEQIQSSQDGDDEQR